MLCFTITRVAAVCCFMRFTVAIALQYLVIKQIHNTVLGEFVDIKKTS